MTPVRGREYCLHDDKHFQLMTKTVGIESNIRLLNIGLLYYIKDVMKCENHVGNNARLGINCEE